MNPPQEKLFMFWNSVRHIVHDLETQDSKLTEDHENRIRHHYNQLLGNLNVPDVVTQMFQSGKLTAKEHEHIRQFYSTPIRASEELLNVVIMNSREVYECFLECLKKTRQHYVYQMLNSDEETSCIGEQSVSEHIRLIRQNYDWLTESLNTDSGLLTSLVAKEVLSQREYGQVVFEKDPFVKNEILLCIISRKSTDDFKKFISALRDTLQGHIAKRLTETPVGIADQQIAPAVEKAFPPRCSDSPGKRMLPKPPPKPKKQTPTTPSIKPIFSNLNPSMQPEIHKVKPNQIKKQQNVANHKIMKKRPVQCLEAKLKELPNELQTEISTKMFLIHRRTSTDNIWKIPFTKILEESRNIKRQNIMQATAADENCERLMHDIIQRERECRIIKEDIQREKTIAKKQLRELQETVHELEDRHKITENDNRNLRAKLNKKSEIVEDLLVLIEQKEQEVSKKVGIITKCEGDVTNSEMKLKEMDVEAGDVRDKLIEKEVALEATTVKLKETQDMLEEANAKLHEFETILTVTCKGTGDMRSDVTLFDLKQKLEDERRVWEEEREQLIKQTQKLPEEFSAEIPYRYWSDPVLVQQIRKISRKKTTKLVSKIEYFAEDTDFVFRGLAILDKELFVVSSGNSNADVYDLTNYSFSHRLNLKELIDPMDMVSCSRNKCLYIMDYKVKSQSKEILKFKPDGRLIKKWSTGYDWGWNMSVTTIESHVILTVNDRNKLNEYSSEGQLIREITLKLDAGFSYPWHALKLTNDDYLVSHGVNKNGNDLHRVCIVDGYGNLKKSFGGKPGSTIGELNLPVYLSVDENGLVMVVDQANRRVLLLDSDLKFIKQVLSGEGKPRLGLKVPWTILLDESNGRLLVADNETKNMRILIFAFGQSSDLKTK